LFTANTLMKDNGLEITITWDKGNNLYFDGIPIEYATRLGFQIIKQPSIE